MDSKRIIARMNGILKVVEKAIKENDTEVERLNSGVNPDIDILSSSFTTGINDDQVLSNIYFLPVAPVGEGELEPDMLYLVQALTIRDDLSTDEQKLLVLQALNYINFHMPYGTFVMDDTMEIVTYRNVIHIYEGLDDADSLMYVFREINSGNAIVGLYVSAINALADKVISWEDFLNIVSVYTEKL